MAEVKIEFKTIRARAAERSADAVRRSIDRVVKASEKLGPSANNAARRVRSAFQRITIGKLQKDFDRARMSAEGLSKSMGATGSAFGRLKGQVTTGRISMEKFNSSVHKIRAELGSAAVEANKTGGIVNRFSGILGRGRGGAISFSGAMTGLAQNIRLVRGPLDGIAARVSTFAAIARQGAASGSVLIATFSIMAAAVAALTAGLFALQRSFEPLLMRFRVAEGSFEGAFKELAFVRQESDRLGISFTGAARNFSSFAAAARDSALSGQQVREVFSGFGTAISALSLNAQQSERIFLALEQMVSKGTVSMEELRRQLGNAIPGAVSAAAKALGVTNAQLMEMVENGEVLASDLLPKMAKVLQEDLADVAAIATLNKELNRMVDTLMDIGRILLFGTGLDQAFTAVLKAINTGLALWRDLLYHTLKMVRDLVSEIKELMGLEPLGPMPALMQIDPGENLRPGSGTDNQLTKDEQRRLEERRDILAELLLINKDLKREMQAIGSLQSSTGFLPEMSDFEFNRLKEAAAAVNEIRETKNLPALAMSDMTSELPSDEAQAARLAAQNFEMARGLELFREHRTPMEEYNQKMRELEGLLDANAISQKTFARAAQAAKEELAESDTVLSRWNDQLERGQSIYESTRTPLEEYRQSMAELRELLQAGAISQETFDRASKQTMETLVQNDRVLSTLSNGFKSFFGELTQGLRNGESALASFEQAFTRFANTIADKIMEIYITDSITEGIGGILSGLDFGKLFKRLSHPGPMPPGGGLSQGPGLHAKRAGGGPVKAGHSYMVGERGMERFIPSVDGTIVSNDNLGGSRSQSININIYNEGGGEVETEQNGPDIDVIIRRSVSRDIAEGGQVFNTMKKTFELKQGLNRRG